MKKLSVSFLALITALSLSLSCFASYDAAYLSDEEYIQKDELVTVIVELGDDPVLSSETAGYSAEFYASSKGKMRTKKVLSNQDAIISEIEDRLNAPIEPKHTYTAIFNGFSVQVPESLVDDIEMIANVKNVYVTYPLKLYLDTAVEETSSDFTQTSTTPQTAYTGKGQVIAIIDNQFETSHEFFSVDPISPKYTKADIYSLLPNTKVNSSHYNSVYISPKIPFAYNYADKSRGLSLKKSYSNNLSIPHEDNHGNHIAGIAAGNNGTLKGVAPDAQLLLMRTMTDDGILLTDAALEAFDNAVILGADVINLSIGRDYLSPASDFKWDGPLTKAKEQGIAVCLAAGNSKFGFSAVTNDNNVILNPPSVKNPDNSAIGTPGSFSSATTVASVNNTHIYIPNSNQGTSSIPNTDSPGEISSFSSWGVNETLELKPEISAPGGKIYSSFLSGYGLMSGTSMSSPHMAGIYALMHEYFDKQSITPKGPKRISMIENMLMSAATIIRQSDLAPYSTRAQGAGLANTAAAIKTPVVLIGSSGKSALSLGDKLSDTFTLNFVAKNLTSFPVTYDRIGVEVTTNIANGQNFTSRSKALEVLNAASLPQKIVVPAASEIPLSLQIKLDNSILQENAEIFTNGFFIDGFAILKTSDNSAPEISIPFTGFYGDWTDAPALDRTMYDEGKSELYIKDATSGTVLITESNNRLIICGGTNGIYDKNRIAISPNGDSQSDSLGIGFTTLRAIKDISLQFISPSGANVYWGKTGESYVVPKYTEKTLFVPDSNLKDLAEGTYSLVFKARFNHSNAQNYETISLPVVVDYTSPQFLDVDLTDENKLTVKAKDNHQINYIEVKIGSALAPQVSYIPTSESKEATCEFTLPENISKDEVKITLTDCANNKSTVDLNNALGKIIPNAASSKNDLLTFGKASFNLFNTGSSDITGDITLACYDSFGALIKVSSLKDRLLTHQANTPLEFSDLGDVGETQYYKLFIWNNLFNLNPSNSAMTFY